MSIATVEPHVMEPERVCYYGALNFFMCTSNQVRLFSLMFGAVGGHYTEGLYVQWLRRLTSGWRWPLTNVGRTLVFHGNSWMKLITIVLLTNTTYRQHTAHLLSIQMGLMSVHLCA